MSSRFSTLLLREWMQHKRGWLITLLLPPLLFRAILPYGAVQGLPLEHPMPIMLLIVLASSTAVFGITYASAMFQLSGLARRDQQDRSIEFWLSLPASHSESVAAPLVAHAVLMPLAALVVGFGFGAVIAPALIAKQGGAAALAGVPWLAVLSIGDPVLLRALFGVLLMSLWLAPLMLGLMTASAWLKRWGVPAVLVGVGVGGLVAEKVYGSRIVWDLIDRQMQGAGQAMLADADALRDQLQQIYMGLHSFHAGSWALHDALLALQGLVSPNFIGGLLVAAGGFALLVFKRSRA